MTDDREPVFNIGHLAAWGAIVAGQLAESRVRYTAMTRDNIIFSPADNRVRVVGGGSSIVPIAWPSDARLHHEDIALFTSEFGTALTSALRLGYTYRLGPIGEWIFFEPDVESVVGPPTGRWSEEWEAPREELRLGHNCSLDPDEMSAMMERGSVYREQRDLVASKRCFMRCYLAAVAAENEVAMAVSLANLATTYWDERRWCRVLALVAAAGLVASALPDDVKVDWMGRLWNEARSHEPGSADSITRYLTDQGRIGESFTEILWRLEDQSILRELHPWSGAKTNLTDGS
jgi:hypothetical protein